MKRDDSRTSVPEEAKNDIASLDECDLSATTPEEILECDADRNISDSNVNSDANKSAVSEVIHEQDVVHEVLDGVEASGDSTISCANETSKPNDVKRGKLGMVYYAFVPPPMKYPT